jgi:hypothetical protein
MLNDKDVSGMYSKIGRVLYEKMHILRKKEEILYPERKKRPTPAHLNEMDDLVRSY